MDDLECQCGNPCWEDSHNGDPVCTNCNTGPRQEGRTHRSVHIARKDYYPGIKAGDKYCRAVTFGHYPGGAFTLSVRKTRLEKGPGWAVEDVMES
jgi:hypothetical protein